MRLASASEISTGLYAVSRLAVFDASVKPAFRNTEEAFWKSFTAAVIAAPLYVLLVSFNAPEAVPTASFARIVAVEAISYVIGWVLFPLVMVAFTDSLDRSSVYFQFIEAWNWSIVLQVLLFVLVGLATYAGIVPRGMVGIVSLAAAGAVFVYQGFIARVMLDIRVRQAIAVVAIDVGLSFAIRLVSGMLY